MSYTGGNSVRLYLPLLTHAQAEVRRQACAILLNLRHEIAQAYRSYLRAAIVTPLGDEGRHNPVVRTYQELTGARDVG